MIVCAVCKKKYLKGTGAMFRVPKDKVNRNKWGEICGVNLSPSARICADHFLSSSIVKVGNTINLMPNAEPFMGQLQQFLCLNQPMEQQEIEDSTNNEGTNLQIAGSQSLSPTIKTGPSAEIFFGDPINSSSYPLFICQKEEGTQTDNYQKNVETQTDFHRMDARMDKNLKCQLTQANLVVDAVRNIFTERQVRKIMSPGGVQWRWEDISSAICLHASGPRAYNHLYKKGFPLPHKSTLQRWCAKIHVSEGILSSSLDFMRQTNDLAPEDKICVLAFDEMKVAETFEYDSVSDVVRKPSNYVQVIMARGLKKSWKQPVFYDFDCKMTKPLLTEVIMQLHNVSFPVVAIVCDMGPTNRKLWKDLGVTTEKPWFPSPVCADEKVFVFADAPHLLKLTRNHFLDSGVNFENTVVSPRTIRDLLALTSKSDVSIAFKVTDEHLSVKGAGRQKVKPAAQLFSNTTAHAIRRCYTLGMQLYNPTNTADFVQLVNDWFDILNSSVRTFKYPGKEPYGLALECQNKILQKMNNLMSSPIVPGRKNLEPFQKGIIITNTALMMLQEYVERYNMTYLVTNRLNQDVLENFFGAIRSKGGLNDHPSPRDFKYRLRKYILAKNTEHLNGKGNVTDDSTDWYNYSLEFKVPQNTKECEEKQIDELEDPFADPSKEEEFVDLGKTTFDDIGILQEDALEYISGYVIKKLNLEEYECNINSFTWVDEVSNGFLKKPTQHFLDEFKKMEVIFENVNGTQISHRQNLQQHLLERSTYVNLPEKVKRLFYKCRIYFRVRHLNKRLRVQKAKQKIMGSKKMIKINL